MFVCVCVCLCVHGRCWECIAYQSKPHSLGKCDGRIYFMFLCETRESCAPNLMRKAEKKRKPLDLISNSRNNQIKKSPTHSAKAIESIDIGMAHRKGKWKILWKYKCALYEYIIEYTTLTHARLSRTRTSIDYEQNIAYIATILLLLYTHTHTHTTASEYTKRNDAYTQRRSRARLSFPLFLSIRFSIFLFICSFAK